MSEPADFDAEVEVAALAERLCGALGWYVSDELSVAVALDRLSDLAGELRDRAVLSAVFRRRVTWPMVGRRFGISRQAASKRWGR